MSILTKEGRERVKGEIDSCELVRLGPDDTATIMLHLRSAIDAIDALEAENETLRAQLASQEKFITALMQSGGAK